MEKIRKIFRLVLEDIGDDQGDCSEWDIEGENRVHERLTWTRALTVMAPPSQSKQKMSSIGKQDRLRYVRIQRCQTFSR